MIVVIQGFDKDGIAEALKGADLVIIPAGVPRKPGMTRDDLFNVRLVGCLASVIMKSAKVTLSPTDQCWHCQDTAHSSSRALPWGRDGFLLSSALAMLPLLRAPHCAGSDQHDIQPSQLNSAYCSRSTQV